MDVRRTSRSETPRAASSVAGAALTAVLGLVALAGTAQAEIALVQHLGTASSKTPGSSLAVTLANPVMAGHSIVVTFAMDDDAAGVVTCADDSGGSHTWGIDVDGANSGNVRTVICSAHDVQNVSAGTVITVTHPSVTARAMSAADFRGLAQASTLDRTQWGAGSSANPASGTTAVTMVANELLIGAIGVEGPIEEAFTPGALWTALPRDGTTTQGANSNTTLDPEYRIVSATGAYQANGTITARDWVAAIATYKEDPFVLTVGATGAQTASLAIPSANQYVGGAFTLVRDSTTTDVTEIVLSETSTINATADLSSVKIYYETAASCTYDGTESVFATASSFDLSEEATLTSFVADTVTYNSAGSLFDFAAGIVVDSADNVYVAGSVGTNGTDWAVRRYDSAGNLDLSWGSDGMVTYNSGGTQYDALAAIAIDASDSIYLVGYQQTNGYDWAVRKYDSSGSLDTTWGTSGMVTWTSAGTQSDFARAIAIDTSSNIYVAGMQDNAADWVVNKYDATGTLDGTWGTGGTIIYDSGGSDDADAIAVDAASNIYVAGYTGTFNRNWAVRKYDATGTLDGTWGTGGVVTYDSGGNDEVRAITVDASSRIYVAGSIDPSNYDWAVRKYDATGTLDGTWGSGGMVTYDSGGSQSDIPNAILLDSADNLYVAGQQGTNTTDWAVRKYDAAGTLDATWGSGGMVNYSTAGGEEATGVALDSAGSLYVAGFHAFNGTDWALRKYDLTGDLCEPLNVGTSQVCLYAVLDVGSGASDGDLLDIEIADACTDVTTSRGSVDPCGTVALSGTTTLSTTDVTLSSLRALGLDGEVLLEWETASELQNLGFHLYRSLAESGPYERITLSLIPGLGSSATGASYSYRDVGLGNGVTYHYQLEDVETTGKTERHGPVSATPMAATDDAGGGGGDGSSSDEGTSNPGSGVEESLPARITYGDPESGSLRLLRRNEQGVELELVTGGFYATPEPDGSVRLEIPGFAESGGPGTPAVPVRRHLLEAVAGRHVRVTAVRPERVVGFSSLRPSRVGVPEAVVGADGTVRPGRRPARAIWPARGLYPEEPAQVVGTAFQGEVKKALVELAPLRWDPASGQLLLAQRLVVRLAFAGREGSEISLGGHRGRGHREPRSHIDRSVLVRLVAHEPGLHAVAFEELFPSRQRPLFASELRLSRRDEAVAFHLEPRRDRFGPGSMLYFLSEGPTRSDYAREAVYELSLGPEGVAMPVGSASPGGAVVSYAFRHQVWERNRFYLPGLLEAPDLWLWDWLISGTRKSHSLGLNGLIPSSEPARLSVWLQGVSDFEVSPDHHVRVFVNGFLVAEGSWDGKTAHRLQAELTPGLLHDGANLLEIENVADTGAAYSMVGLDRLALDFPQVLAAEAGIFEGSFSLSGSATLGGLGAGGLVLDTTEAPPRWLGHAVPTEPGLALRVDAGRRYLAVAPGALRPPEIRWPTASGLKRSSNQADYLVVAPREFLSVAMPLLERRRAQGLTSRAVALEEIYEVFGYGEPAPEALKDFLAYAYHHWTAPAPRYVLLLGDATVDPRGYTGTGGSDRVPAWMLKSTYLWTASDPAYAAVNGEDGLPDLALGRLPASSVEEAQTLVRKILDFETGGFDMSGRAVLVADNPDIAGDFEANADEIAAGILTGRATEKIYLRSRGRAGTRSAILDAFDGGASLMSYIGHGGTAVWASENVLNSWDMPSLAPQAQQPLVLTMDCLNGYFLPTNFDSLAEALVKAEGRGAVAAFSPSGLSLDGPAHLYHKALLGEIVSGAHARLGDAILAAQTEYADTGAFPELLQIYHLFGDPALAIR